MGNPYAAKKKDPAQEPEKVSHDLGVAELSVKKVLAFVGYDLELAQAALDEEREGKNRTTLVSELEDILNG